MYRKKDFLFMKVSSIKGKSIGFIKDIIVDFHIGGVLGFSITSYMIFGPSLYVLKENILSFNESMIVDKWNKGNYLQFSDIVYTNVIDLHGNIIGMADDIIFDEKTFLINGIVVSTGYLTNFIHGKKIILIKDIILGKDSILYYGNKDKIILSNIPSNLFKLSREYEELPKKE
ncbi:uncharacterized protein YrrD [Clostridium tetanomorphum]|uniref:Photosystem reaction center subunit H n=1 Tax=Clostridium tetanomorphum TaxID=1553 RepID=A0A923J2W1_CLOTT|nr:PRC-barrel domain-containing protein [Clostridium tetanomorphum]KAJ52810.1 hypothetical protein CTM_05745 [Clostridium tetanomorphum DSM 665]MBC2399203.1 photosystem reaction center subunit H [Clostridium tetanomorphum]MBP1865395.1 uncharacterized protein YrrD [Clostridium tetanomorphum]NRS84838.1 uncharacterized protein YrrD [Clostridium tetanomorphum]NRZ98055.1 uncharacterized protein YrrD [Clostridium tetanomorphum]